MEREKNFSSGIDKIDSVQAHLTWNLKVEELRQPREEKHFKSNILRTFVFEDEIKWQLWVNICEEKEEKRIFVVPLSHSFQENSEREIKCSVFFQKGYSEVFMKTFKKGLAKWTGVGEGFSFSSQTLLEMTNSGCLNIIVDLIIPVNMKQTKCESQIQFNADIFSISKMDQFSDVTVICKGQEFCCHKLILAARSPVFKTMLGKDMLEKNKNVINIEDSNPDSVRAMLDHIYTGNLPDKGNMDNLLYLGVKYNLKGIINSFVANLRSPKNPKSILKNLVLCYLYFPESEAFLEVLGMAKETKLELMLQDTWEEMVEFYPNLSSMIMN